MSKNSWQNLGLAALTAVTLAGAVWLLASWPPTPEPSDVSAVQHLRSMEPKPAPSPAQSLDLPDNPRLLIVGDSYTAGTGAAQPSGGYAYRAAATLGWPHRIDGIGGTGFTTGGDTDFLSRVREWDSAGFDPNVVILQGGQNDYRADMEQRERAVERTVRAVRQQWPGVRVLVKGPMAPYPLASTLSNIDAALRAGALDSGAVFIDPLAEDWITPQNSDRFGYSDGAHLSPAGHRHVARLLVEEIHRLSR